MDQPSAASHSQAELDDIQYTKKRILRYEWMYGETFVSTGGLRTTQDFCRRLRLGPSTRVLDIGVGTGGSAFYLAREFGCHVTGVDLSRNMVAIAEERRLKLSEEMQTRLEFKIADITTVNYPASTFDVIYSRDSILHIADKLTLYRRCLSWLKPGGQLLISDFCQGDQSLSEEFVKYRDHFGYHLLTVSEYGRVIQEAGFEKVEAIDNTKYFVRCLTEDIASFKGRKDDFIKEFTQTDFDEIVDHWESKIRFGTEGSQAWGLLQASKPSE